MKGNVAEGTRSGIRGLVAWLNRPVTVTARSVKRYRIVLCVGIATLPQGQHLYYIVSYAGFQPVFLLSFSY